MSNVLNGLKYTTFYRNNKFNINFVPVGTKWGASGASITGIFPWCVANSNLPDLVDTPLEEYVGEDWKYTRGKRETYIINSALRAAKDPDIYKFFAEKFIEFERVYPKDQFCQIEVELMGDGDGATPTSAYRFDKCILTGVSGLPLDHSTPDALLEFTLTFKSAKFIPILTGAAKANMGNISISDIRNFVGI